MVQTNTSQSSYLILAVRLKGVEIIALTDTGAMNCYVANHDVKNLQITMIPKQQSYILEDATRKQISKITEHTAHMRIAIQQHTETISFDILEMATQDIILGMPWLQSQNPVIHWTNKTLRFRDGITVNAYRPGESRVETTDENAGKKYRGMYVLQGSTQGQLKMLPATTGSEIGQTDQQVSSYEGTDMPSIPQEYAKWIHLFEEQHDKQALPKHQDWDHEIKLVEGKQSTFGPIYQLSEKELKELDAYLKTNLGKGFIRPSSSSAGYPILFVPKKDGRLRLCVDYRKLNEITIKNRYPLPNANELRDRLTKAQWFTKMDMRGAYNLIRMKEGEGWKTAFRTRYGSYEYMVMPFGLTNAPASCQELVNNVLRNMLDQSVIAYLDDILIYSKTLSQHKIDITKVLTCLDKVNLQLEPKKCEFHRKEVQFLGYVVTTEEIRQDPDKIKAILEWPEPTSVKELQSFLGTINFNRKFIQGFSQTSLALTRLTRKDTAWTWTGEQQKAFDKLKEACTKDPVLRTFKPGDPIRIETDASDTATGACLLQKHDDKWHPVAYYSRKMTDTEQNYDIHDKELLAIVTAFQQWRVYAEGATDVEV